MSNGICEICFLGCCDCCDCSCCCNPLSRRCYEAFIIFTSVFIFVFQLIIVVTSSSNSINPEDFESYVLSETPLYDFEISENDIKNKKYITFFHFKGRKKGINTTTIYDEKNITKIFKNKFYYNGKDRNYLDYVNNYSVAYNSECPINYKSCGILDSAERILCLPNDEECPLNGFHIFDLYDSKEGYEGYNIKEVYDSRDDSKYYIYYTNNNTKGKVITEFKLSAGTPCASSSKINWYKLYNDEVEKEFNCNSNSDRYFQVSYGIINIINLYKDNGLTDPPDNNFYTNPMAYLYAKNYNEIDVECFIKFMKDFNDEKKYYRDILSVIRVLGAISVTLIVAMFIYMLSVYCRNVKFYSLSFIVSVYGIIYNIIVLFLINKDMNVILMDIMMK